MQEMKILFALLAGLCVGLSEVGRIHLRVEGVGIMRGLATACALIALG